MDVYSDALLRHTSNTANDMSTSPEAVVDMYLAKGYPLRPLRRRTAAGESVYDGGNHLGNIALEVTADKLSASFLLDENPAKRVRVFNPDIQR